MADRPDIVDRKPPIKIDVSLTVFFLEMVALLAAVFLSNFVGRSSCGPILLIQKYAAAKRTLYLDFHRVVFGGLVSGRDLVRESDGWCQEKY